MSNSLSDYQPMDDVASKHISIVVPRIIKGDDYQHDYTYFQLVCSCGYHGEWRASKVTAQMDSCENKHFNR